MNYWEFRQAIESMIPAWVVVAAVVIALLSYLWLAYKGKIR